MKHQLEERLESVKYESNTTTIRDGKYHPGTLNAIARALGRLELASEWAGADHDMPGTTQDEREMTRWAAIQFLDELTKELIDAKPSQRGDGIPELGTPGHTLGRLVAGPFKSLRETVPAAEQETQWPNGQSRLHATSEKKVIEHKLKEYHTPLWENKMMTDHELERSMFEFDPFEEYRESQR